MGKYFFDQYSILHLATGIIAYFFGVSFNSWLFLHIVFEIVENSSAGVNFIDKNIPFWPGGKSEADSLINSISDIAFSALGWFIACRLDIWCTSKGLNTSKLL